MGGEDLVEAHDAENPADSVGDRGQGDGGVGGKGDVASGDQDRDAGGVTEGEPAEVDDELLARLDGRPGEEDEDPGRAVVVEFPASSMTRPKAVVRVRTSSSLTAALHVRSGAR